MFKKITSLVLVLTLTLTLGMSLAVFANDSRDSDSLVTDYENQMLNKIALKEGTEKEELSSEFRKYENLNKSDKLKFVKVVTDPDFIIQALTAQTSFKLMPGQEIQKTTTRLKNDFVIESTAKENSLNSINQNLFSVRSATQSRTATYTYSGTLYGVKIFEAKNTLEFERTGYDGIITEINGTDHRITRNYSVLTIEYSGGYDKILTGSKMAVSKRNVTAAILIKGSWTVGDGESYIDVDVQEVVTGRFWVSYD